jgi:hypothetical protein
MKIEFNFYWGLMGLLGLLGYVLENPAYYVFFALFLLAFVPNISGKINSKKNLGKNQDDIDRDYGSLSSYNIYNICIGLGSTLLIISSLSLIIWKTMNDILAITLLLGVMIFTTTFFTYLGMEKPEKDERIRKIGTTSATYSWYVTISLVCFLLITGYWSGVPRTGTELLGVTIFVMVTTMIGTNTYLKYKGDVE